MGEEKIMLNEPEIAEIIRIENSRKTMEASVLIARKAKAIADQRGCNKKAVILAIVRQAGLTPVLNEILLNPKGKGPHGRAQREKKHKELFGRPSKRRY
ncbi:MAG: hypothetical protein ABIH20_03825 [Candidatus Diapherotrites archaeon]